MPRPKRPKIVHTVPLLRGARPALASSITKQLRSVSPSSSGRATNTTDDSDGLVTTQRIISSARNPSDGEKYTMTGALGEEENAGTRLRPPSTRVVEEANRVAREAEYARIKAGRRKAREIALENSGDRIQIPSTMRSESITRQASRTGPSTVQSRRPSIISRGQQTPLAHSLTLGAAIFKKRPRQPSLLQMAQSQQAPGEVDDDEDLDDFRPDDESTPLIKSLTRSNAAETSSSSRHTSGSRKRKLSSPEIQVPASQAENIFSSPLQPPERNNGSETAEEPELAEPFLPTPHDPLAPDLEIFSDTLAPPQSSSSPPPIINKHTKNRKASTRTTSNPRNTKENQQNQHKARPSDDSPTTTTSTPTSPVRQPLRPLTTAHLQNLLPRRRTRHKPSKGAYDLPSDSDEELNTTHLSENEDELSFQAAGKLRRKPKTPARTMPSAKKNAGAKARNLPATTEKSKRLSRTYSRKKNNKDHHSSDSNPESADEEDDDSLGPVKTRGKGKGKGMEADEGGFDAKAKKEMQRLAKKFEEVDEYELEFEDVTGGGSSSQMADAR